MAARLRATEKKIKRHINSRRPQPVKMAVWLSLEAKKALEQLRLRYLDKEGRRPTGSQVIESLLKAVVANEKVPYPAP